MQYAQREPWRAQAESNCLKSGVFHESAGRVRIEPIAGPGMCGATQPFKISMLGESGALGFTDEPIRPPGSVSGGSRMAQPPWPASAPRNLAAGNPPPLAEPRVIPAMGNNNNRTGAPLSIAPPGLAQPNDGTEPAPQRQALGAPPQNLGTLRMATPPPDAQEDDEPAASWPRTIPASPPQTARPLPALGPQRAPSTQLASAVELKPIATLACPIVSALDQWILNAVQPAAQRWFGQPVVTIKQISAYSCRGMNGQAGAHISEHAFGNALDIAAFVMADGHVVTVKGGWQGTAEEQGFLRDIQGAACEQFTTVLAPGSNRFHYDHIHVDLMRRASGRRICQPGAIDGELVAARVRKDPTRLAARPEPPPTRRYDPPFDARNDPFAWRGDAARRGDPASTGSIGSRRGPAHRPAADDDNDWIEDDGPRLTPE